MCTWMSMSTRVRVHTEARSQLQVSFFRTLPTLCFETGSLTGLEGNDSARLMDPQPPLPNHLCPSPLNSLTLSFYCCDKTSQ